MLLQTADYNFAKNNPNWDLVLDFKIDVGGGEEVNKKVLRTFPLFYQHYYIIIQSEMVQRLARRFKSPHGRKEVTQLPKNKIIYDY